MDNSEYDYLIIDKATGEQLARFTDEAKVLPYTLRFGRNSVEIKKIKRKETTKMNKPVQETSSIVNLSEMKIEKVKEDLLLPKTNNPEKEAEKLTDDTGIYHYAVDDEMTGKPAIVRTNVKALNEAEWIKKTFYTSDEGVVEPNDFEKNDQYEVSSIDQVAEGYDRDAWAEGYEAFEKGQPCPSDPSAKDGWMEAKKEHRKAGQMDEADYDRGNSDNWDDDHSPAPSWSEAGIGLFKHNYLPLAYDDNSGQVVLYDIDGASNLDDAEAIGMFGSVEEMEDWIASNIRQDVAEEYRRISEANVSTITTAERGSDQEQSLYGPAPEDDQNDMEFDKDGKFVLEGKYDSGTIESHIDLPDADDVEVEVGYEADGGDIMINYVTLKGTDEDVYGYCNAATLARFADEVVQEIQGRKDDEADYRHEMMRDRQMEEDVEPQTHEYQKYDLVKIIDPASSAHNEYGYIDGEEDGLYKVTIYGTGFYGLYDKSGIQPATQEEVDAYHRQPQTSDVEEGKDWRFDPDADEEDHDRQDRMKDRKRDRETSRKEVDESEGSTARYKVRLKYGRFEIWDNQKGKVVDSDTSRETAHKICDEMNSKQVDEAVISEADDISRAFMLTVDFTVDRVELTHKGMTDIDSAVALAADGQPKDKVMNQIQMGGLPTSFELHRDNAYTIIVLDTTLRSAIESMVSVELCQELLAELDINEDVFYGFLIQAKTGDILDGSTELEEDEMYEAPDFVVSSEKLFANEMAEDPMFVQVMNDAYLTVAEKYGEKVESFNPSMEQIDEVIAQAIDSYPNGQKYSFMMSDPMAHDAIIEAFNMLWDQGKIDPEHM